MAKIIQYKKQFSLAYTDCGEKSGFPVLVQHGLVASIDDCYLFQRLLDSGRRVICIARTGYGESSPYLMQSFAEWADIVVVLAGELGLSQFDVLGISSGAPYSYALGSQLPEKVRNIYIFSGIPALYDDKVLSHWPNPVTKNADIGEMQKLARELFFSDVTPEEMKLNDIRDSMRNDCFGVAQDLRLRGLDWGFTLAEIQAPVFMEHSQDDPGVPYITAALTAKLLPCCTLKARAGGEHFSAAALDDFIKMVMLERVRTPPPIPNPSLRP